MNAKFLDPRKFEFRHQKGTGFSEPHAGLTLHGILKIGIIVPAVIDNTRYLIALGGCRRQSFPSF